MASMSTQADVSHLQQKDVELVLTEDSQRRSASPRPSPAVLPPSDFDNLDPNTVAEALKIARYSPDGARDPVVCGILESALAQLWDRVTAQPESYVMSTAEFAVLNFYQHRFVGNKLAVAARRRFWDNTHHTIEYDDVDESMKTQPSGRTVLSSDSGYQTAPDEIVDIPDSRFNPSAEGFTGALVEEYVDILVHDANLEKLISMSLSPGGIEPELFAKKYSMILYSYAEDLKMRAAWSEDSQTMAFISRPSTTMTVAELIASRYRGKETRGGIRTDLVEEEEARVSIKGLDHQDEPEMSAPSDHKSPGTQKHQSFFKIDGLGIYLREGAPFRQMKRELRNLVIPSALLSSARSSTQHLLDWVFGDEYLRFLLLKAFCASFTNSRDSPLDPHELIRHFGTKLKAEGSSPDHLHLANFLETYSRYIDGQVSKFIPPVKRITIKEDMGHRRPQTYMERLKRLVSSLLMSQKDFNDLGSRLIQCSFRYSQPLSRLEPVSAGGTGLKADSNTVTKDKSKIPGKTDVVVYEHFYRPYLSLDSVEVLETIIDDTLPNICDPDIKDRLHILVSTGTFKESVESIRDIAVPTFFSEATNLVTKSPMGDEEPNTTASREGFLRVLAEVQWCFMQTGVAPTINISSSKRSLRSLESLHFSNSLKLAVEATSRSDWQWWPLQPPISKGKLTAIEPRISWTCDCGTEREEIVPYIYASKLSQLASQFPLSNELPVRPPSSLSNSSSQASETTTGSEGQSTDFGASSTSGSSSLHSGTAATSPGSSVVSFASPRKAFVFLVVKAGTYTLAPIDVTQKTARDFFKAIVDNYKHKRGWRRLLSIYVYSHSDFVKIRRYSPQSFDPGFRFSFPPHDESPHDKEYGYYPRPMTHAPVSRHMFNHLFNACYSSEGLAHKLHSAFVAPSCIIKTIPGKLLDGMPKRDRLVDEAAEFSEDQDAEVFWGLVAREQRSALRVFVYMLLSLAPSLWFMFQWLFGWGHGGDLQDATVPLMFSATMLIAEKQFRSPPRPEKRCFTDKALQESAVTKGM
ncbi:hypothetical protein diail_5703 [Diaporthe ilicicola]|nr:hypothetical protein diail_5703 [Diaporthe ilicicola]